MMFSRQIFVFSGLAVLAWITLSGNTRADIVFYTNESAWRSAVTNEEDFLFTAINVAKANEVTSPPGNNAFLGPILTFESGNTGLSTSLVLTTLEPGAGFTFNDNEGSGPEWDNALSIGDINNYEDDDWQMTFDSNSVFHFGWWLQDNEAATGESFSVYDKANDMLLGTLTTIPATEGIDFIGFTSTVPIGRVVFDEDAGGDDVAIGGFVLSSTAIPEPSSALLVGMAFVLAGIQRRAWGAGVS